MLKRSFKRLFWRIGEVVQLTGLEQQTLRNWEQDYKQLRPRRDSSGVRVYRERDLRLVLLLQQLIERDGLAEDEVAEVLSGPKAGLNALLDEFDLDTLSGDVDEKLAPTSGGEAPDETDDADSDDEADDDDEDDDETESPEEDMAATDLEPIPLLRVDEPVSVRKALVPPSPAVATVEIESTQEPQPEEVVPPAPEPLEVDDHFALTFITPALVEESSVEEEPEPEAVPRLPSNERFALSWVTPRTGAEPEPGELAPDLPEPLPIDSRFALSFITPAVVEEPPAVEVVEPAAALEFNPRFALRYVNEAELPAKPVAPPEPLFTPDPHFALSYIHPRLMAVPAPEPEPEAVENPIREPDTRFALSYVTPQPGWEPEPEPVPEPVSVDERFALSYITPSADWTPEPEPELPPLAVNDRFALAYIHPDDDAVPVEESEPEPPDLTHDLHFALAFIGALGDAEAEHPVLDELDEDEPRSVRPMLSAPVPPEPVIETAENDIEPVVAEVLYSPYYAAQGFPVGDAEPEPMPVVDAAEPVSVRPPLSESVRADLPVAEEPPPPVEVNERFALTFASLPDEPMEQEPPALSMPRFEEPVAVLPPLEAPTAADVPVDIVPLAVDSRFALAYVVPEQLEESEQEALVPPDADEPVSVQPPLAGALAVEPESVEVNSRFALAYVVPEQLEEADREALVPPDDDEPVSIQPPLAGAPVVELEPEDELEPVSVDERFALRYISAAAPEEPDTEAMPTVDLDEPVSVRGAAVAPDIPVPVEPEGPEQVPDWVAEELVGLRGDLAEVVARLEEWAQGGPVAVDDDEEEDGIDITSTDATIEELDSLVTEHLVAEDGVEASVEETPTDVRPEEPRVELEESEAAAEPGVDEADELEDLDEEVPEDAEEMLADLAAEDGVEIEYADSATIDDEPDSGDSESGSDEDGTSEAVTAVEESVDSLAYEDGEPEAEDNADPIDDSDDEAEPAVEESAVEVVAAKDVEPAAAEDEADELDAADESERPPVDREERDAAEAVSVLESLIGTGLIDRESRTRGILRDDEPVESDEEDADEVDTDDRDAYGREEE